MVMPLKTRGLQDIHNLRGRAARLFALRRIGDGDYKYIDERLAEVEARIIEMRERGTGREVPF